MFRGSSRYKDFAFGAVLAVLVVGGLWYWHDSSSHSTPATASKAVGSTTTIAVKGESIKAAATSSLSFNEAGTIATVNVSQGNTVTKGQTLATLSTYSSLSASLANAKTTLSKNQAKLATLNASTSITASTNVSAVSASTLQNDQNTLTKAQNAVRAAISSAYITAEDAVENKAASTFTAPATAPSFIVFVPNSALILSLDNSMLSSEATITAWGKIVLASSFNTNSDTSDLASAAEKNLTSLGTFLSQVATALNDGQASGSVTASAISSYKSAITTARLNVTNALATITAAETTDTQAQATVNTDIASGKAGQKTTQANTTLTTAITKQKALVTKDQAAVNTLQTQVAATLIVSPTDGKVLKVNTKAGEKISTHASLFVVQAD